MSFPQACLLASDSQEAAVEPATGESQRVVEAKQTQKAVVEKLHHLEEAECEPVEVEGKTTVGAGESEMLRRLSESTFLTYRWTLNFDEKGLLLTGASWHLSFSF